jgi:transposase-like protein
MRKRKTIDELFNGRHFEQEISVLCVRWSASHRAVPEMQTQGELPHDTKLHSSKYLNNMIEQDHRNVKIRIGPMLGFKRFKYAATTIAGIELTHRIRKGQFSLDTLNVQRQAAPAVWYAVLAS